jgi:hypothetical protein
MYNFEPALEMLDEMYDLDLGVEYSEKWDSMKRTDNENQTSSASASSKHIIKEADF